MTPTFAGFLVFVRNQNVPVAALPDDSMWLVYAYDVAIELVNQGLLIAPSIYTLAVYNLGMSNLINFAQDVSGSSYFTNIRQNLNLNSLLPGVVSGASDEGTSVSLATPDFYRNISLADLQYLKDPWGRQYLAFAQRYGSLWGLT